MKLSQKQETFSQISSALLKSTLNFEHFENNMTLIAHVFLKLGTPRKVVKQMSKKSRFRGPFDKQHSKGDQTLLKPEPHHLYHSY